ncbi:MAG: peptidylprolyl isomerase [Candidatus Paceibacteria bacterium]|jgi:peptidylprolyl isomerase
MDSQMKQSLFSIVGLLVICGLLVAGISYWLGDSAEVAEINITNETQIDTPLALDAIDEYEPEITSRMNPIALFETNKGQIEIELYDDAMPITAGNFMKLINEGYYDGIKFHRIIDGFMIQGGDPITKTDEVARYGTGGPGYSIPDEHIAGEKLSNIRGSLSMANSGPNSGGSQFFINLADNTNLDFDKPPLQSKHPVFGQVVAGMDVIDAIASVATGPSDLPLEAVVIEKASIKES